MIEIRGLQLSDAEELFKMRNDESGKRMYSGNILPNSIENEKSWIESLKKIEHEQIVFGITYKGALVGFWQLKNINYINRNADYAIFLSKRYRGKSIGTKATKIALKYAFYQLNLNKVYLYVLDINVTAKKLYKSMGFVESGLLKKHYFVQGEYLDLCYMEIFKRKFNDSK